MERRSEKPLPEDIHDVAQFMPFVSEGVLSRIFPRGVIPGRGPGSYSIPNAIRRIKEERRSDEEATHHGKKTSVLTTKEGRRDWNVGHKI